MGLVWGIFIRHYKAGGLHACVFVRDSEGKEMQGRGCLDI